MEGEVKLFCSFCDSPQDKVKKLISGPNVYSCEDCVALMVDIIREEIDPNFMVESRKLETEIDGKSYDLAYLLGTKKLAWVSVHKTITE